MRKERNEGETSTSATATESAASASTETEKVAVAQQESISENEESDTITDHSSSMSEHKKRSGATQFSVQRSDTDCLRMRISAIRPTVSARVETKCKTSTQKTTHHTTSSTTKTTQNTTKKSTTPTTSTPTTEKFTTKILGDKVNNTLDALRIKLNQQSKKLAASNTMSGRSGGRERSVPIDSKTLTMSLAQSAPCMSDATESECSDATTTTIAAVVNEKATKKVKVKRKKAPVKSNDSKHKNNKKQNQHSTATVKNFTSDSDEDEPLQKLQQQRAPRLLLTAINTKNTQLKMLNSLAPSSGATCENLDISSSDNELPNLVSAAIKRVESDNDDTGGECSSRLSTKTKHLPQYQSTLLQDFVEKTQKLVQTPAVTPARTASPDSAPLLSTPSSQITSLPKPMQSNKIPANSIQKKRRGRPKKNSGALHANAETESVVSAQTVKGATTNTTSTTTINESADSGVISTTSTAQSSSPSPRLSAALVNTTKAETCESPTKSSADVSIASSSSKPKIDFVNLDKRMYATERVLYPPPRNKRRQSTNATALQQQSADKKPASSTVTSTTTTTTAAAAAKITKDELDPVWRKIDVNKKFRRPSVSGYKSDGGGGNTTICSKILAAQSGYVSDYGSAHPRGHHHHSHNSGYKSDASAKSRYSTRSCFSARRSRAKSCGYRSDCKEADKTLKSAKFRRKRRTATLLQHHSKSVGNLNDDQDILQLAGLTLGQSSEESNEFACKPSLKCLPTTSVSKKYGEINRFVATGEYFGRGSTSGGSQSKRLVFDSATQDEDGSKDGFRSFSGKLNLLRKNSMGSELAADVLSHVSRKIKSRRSSVASYCSSYYSGVSKIKRRRRHRSSRFPSSSKIITVDSKLLTEIEIITNTFATLCRIGGHGEKLASNTATLKDKEKLFAAESSSGSSKLTLQLTGVGKRETRDKRSLKKRKLSENLDFALLSASAGGSGGSLTPSSGSAKRRHKKTNSSSPDDHKLPLKKRHYLLTPGEKSSEAAAAMAVKLFANNAEALAAAAAAAKTSVSSLAISYAGQPKFGTKMTKPAITPKKRHLLQTAALLADEGSGSVKGGSNHSSPLRISVEAAAVASLTSSKLLDISPALSNSSVTKQSTDAQVHKKRTRLEGLVSKIANHSDAQPQVASVKLASNLPQLDSENSSCPPPGVFEPTVELEIQIPPIAKLTEAAAIITKSEVDSPLILELNKTFPLPSTKIEGGRVVESLLNKTGGNLLLKRKRKKINRTGFPTVRRKKRKINENLLLDVTPDIIEQVEEARTSPMTPATPTPPLVLPKMKASPAATCDRVPQTGEASDSFLERANRAPPRLSVVSLERLQGTSPRKETASAKRQQKKQERLLVEKRATESPKLVSPRAVTPEEKTRPAAVKTTKQASLSAALEITPGKRQSRKTAKALEMSAAITVRKRKNSVVPPEKQTKPAEISTPPKCPPAETNGIMTIKELKEKRLLPAGIDPKLNFSCKIRLKRRTSLHGIAVAALKESKDCLATEPLAKDPHCDQLEHDVLPLSDVGVSNAVGDSEAASDTSDEKSSSAASTLGGRKNSRWKKNYLTAGLFSDYYKCLEPPMTLSKRQQKKVARGKDVAPPSTSSMSALEITVPQSLLAPPPYCEKYFRRTEVDFELPYDIWWAYKNDKLPSRITVPSWNYRKIRVNIYAESVRPNMAGFDHPTCNCKPDVGCGDDCLNRLVYTECSPTSCPTREKCRNQKIYRHEVAPGVERFMTENKGWGVRTKLPIQKGTYILEYVGEVVTEREFKDRMGTIYLNDTHHYCLHLDGGLVIDGHRMGSDGRFVNHSCQPNCEMQKWSVNGLSRMALFAARNINADEELTYDYNFSLFNPSEGQPCRCDTPQCRGVIGGKSQRIKPLPAAEEANLTDQADGEVTQRNVRQRKRKAKKHSLLLQSKDIGVVARVQQLSEKDKKFIKQHGVFLLRNFEKVRKYKVKHGFAKTPPHGEAGSKPQTPLPLATSPSAAGSPAPILNRRPSTPASLVAQISALRSPRNMKTRGLALANSDPELEKMAKMAVILREICAALESLRDSNDEKSTLISVVFAAPPLSAAAGTKKKKLARAAQQKEESLSFLTIQANIEKGFYKQPSEFDADIQQVLAQAKNLHSGDEHKLKALEKLNSVYVEKKREVFKQLLEVASEEACQMFLSEAKAASNAEAVEKATVKSDNDAEATSAAEATKTVDDKTANAMADGASPNAAAAAATSSTVEADKTKPSDVVDASTAAVSSVINPTKEKSPSLTTNQKIKVPNPPKTTPQPVENVHELNGSLPTEDIIRCICGLYKDEGLMIQCARCMVWQHTECTKADINADNYHCERCEPRQVDREIPLEDFTEDGHRYYLSLLRGDLHIRQGDTVYVLRDIPIRDANGKVIPSKKHTYETIGKIEFTECDIFRVERLWKNEEGKRFIFGHHFLRPHETFHEPTRRFYPNEVVRVPLYEVVPIELVIGRCWVLDRTTFCKGRPMECNDEAHCYICELRVDKTARFFSKAKINYPTCTKNYAFRKFAEKLKIAKTYAPHDVNPAMLKSRKQKTDSETESTASQTPTVTSATSAVTVVGNELNKTPNMGGKKRPNNIGSPATTVQVLMPVAPSLKTIKAKRSHLEEVLKGMKVKSLQKNTQLANEPPLDLTYLLSGRGARQRKSTASASATASSVIVPV